MSDTQDNLEKTKFTFEDVLKWPVVKPLYERLTKKKTKVACIRLSGVIADSNVKKRGLSYESVSKSIDKAFDKSGVELVVLIINSPGGSPAQTSLIANHIRMRAEKDEIPVYAFVEDVAASGGYWLACAADKIYAQESSIVGSIGVISASFGLEDFIARYDIHRRVYTSGKDKSFLDPFKPIQKKDEKRLLEIQSQIHDAFIRWVEERRGDTLEADKSEIFEGQFWDAPTAEAKGLIDGIEGVRNFLFDHYGEDYKLIDVTPSGKLPILSLLNMSSQKRNGMNSIDADLVHEILDSIDDKAIWARYGL